jgi:Spy/CpxP family protein refolding chaperone
MKRKFSSLLKKALFLSGALILGWVARAQSTNPSTTNPSDTTRHHDGMHRHWGNRHDGAHYTPEQRQQVAAIDKDYRQKSADLFKQDNLTLKQYKAGLIALQNEKKDKLQGLLTQQQKDEMASRRQRMSENAQVREVARLERLRLHLNLSDDQVAKIKAGQDGLRSQVKAIHENPNLLPRQKMEQMKALIAKRNDTYKAVLTPDQYTQFEKMHHHGDRFGGDRSGDPMGHRPGNGDDGK